MFYACRLSRKPGSLSPKHANSPVITCRQYNNPCKSIVFTAEGIQKKLPALGAPKGRPGLQVQVLKGIACLCQGSFTPCGRSAERPGASCASKLPVPRLRLRRCPPGWQRTPASGNKTVILGGLHPPNPSRAGTIRRPGDRGSLATKTVSGSPLLVDVHSLFHTPGIRQVYISPTSLFFIFYPNF